MKGAQYYQFADCTFSIPQQNLLTMNIFFNEDDSFECALTYLTNKASPSIEVNSDILSQLDSQIRPLFFDLYALILLLLSTLEYYCSSICRICVITLDHNFIVNIDLMKCLFRPKSKCTQKPSSSSPRPYESVKTVEFMLISLRMVQKINVGLQCILVTICIISVAEDGIYRPARCCADRGICIPLMVKRRSCITMIASGRSNTIEKDTFQSNHVMVSNYAVTKAFV